MISCVYPVVFRRTRSRKGAAPPAWECEEGRRVATRTESFVQQTQSYWKSKWQGRRWRAVFPVSTSGLPPESKCSRTRREKRANWRAWTRCAQDIESPLMKHVIIIMNETKSTGSSIDVIPISPQIGRISGRGKLRRKESTKFNNECIPYTNNRR